MSSLQTSIPILFSLCRGDDLLDVLEHGWVLERRRVTQSVELARGDLAQQTAHDLAGARLGQSRDDVDLQWSARKIMRSSCARAARWPPLAIECSTRLFRTRERTDNFADLNGKFLAELIDGVVAVESALHDDVGNDGLAGELVGNTDHGRLADTAVQDQSALDLSRRQAVTWCQRNAPSATKKWCHTYQSS